MKRVVAAFVFVSIVARCILPSSADVPGAADPLGTVRSSAAPVASATPEAIVVPLPLPAEPLPTVAVLESAMREAHGRDLVRATVVEEEVDADVHAFLTTYVDGDRFREVTTQGARVTQRGFDGRDRWHGNANGEIVVDAPAPEDPAAERPTYSVERATAPLDGFVLVRRLGSSVRRTFVERLTGRVVRVESTSPQGTSVTTYDDFRTTGTATEAWHHAYRDGHPEDASDVTIRSIDLGPVATAALALPAGRRFVEFPERVTKVALPVEMHRDKFVVRVVIDGRGLDFELDTGAAGIVIDETVARQLGLSVVARRGNAANAGRFVQSSVVIPEMKVGDLTMHDVAAATIPAVDVGPQESYRVVGLLGFDFIADTKLVLDYVAGTVTAYDPTVDLPRPTGPHTFTIPVRLGSQTPVTGVAINGTVGPSFLIDSGGAGGLLIFDRFARRHPDALVGDAPDDAKHFYGVGGPIATRAYRLHSVKFGSADLRDFVAYRVLSARQYAGNEDGLIGAAFLRLFTVTIDYPDAEIDFALNSFGANGLAR